MKKSEGARDSERGRLLPARAETPLPVITVVLPTYNTASYLSQALDSLLGQTFEDFELVVVDGGSTDDTLQIVAGYADTRISVVHQSSNSGRLPGALNLGFARARGRYLTWAQGDDRYEPEAFAVLAGFLGNHPEVDFVYVDCWLVNEQDRVIRKIVVLPPENLKEENCIGHCFLYRRQVYERVGDYDVDSFLMEDYDYWFRVSRICRMQVCPVDSPLYFHKLRRGALTGAYSVEERCRVKCQVQEKHLGAAAVPLRLQIARMYIGWAFESHILGDSISVRRYALRAIRYDPSLLTNLGVLSILARSFTMRRQAPSSAPEANGGR